MQRILHCIVHGNHLYWSCRTVYTCKWVGNILQYSSLYSTIIGSNVQSFITIQICMHCMLQALPSLYVMPMRLRQLLVCTMFMYIGRCTCFVSLVCLHFFHSNRMKKKTDHSTNIFAQSVREYFNINMNEPSSRNQYVTRNKQLLHIIILHCSPCSLLVLRKLIYNIILCCYYVR